MSSFSRTFDGQYMHSVGGYADPGSSQDPRAAQNIAGGRSYLAKQAEGIRAWDGISKESKDARMDLTEDDRLYPNLYPPSGKDAA